MCTMKKCYTFVSLRILASSKYADDEKSERRRSLDDGGQGLSREP